MKSILYFRSQLKPVSQISELEKMFKNISKIIDARAEKHKLKIKVRLPNGETKWLFLEDYMEEDA